MYKMFMFLFSQKCSAVQNDMREETCIYKRGNASLLPYLVLTRVQLLQVWNLYGHFDIWSTNKITLIPHGYYYTDLFS